MPVTWELVEATLPYLPEMVQAMVLFGWHTGAGPRKSRLTTGEIQRTGEVWIATMGKHKTAGYGHVAGDPDRRTGSSYRHAVVAPRAARRTNLLPAPCG